MLLFTQISSTCFHIFQALIFSFHVEPQGYIFQFGEHIDDWSWCLWHAPKIGGWSCGGWGDTWVGAAVLVLLQWRNRIEVWNKTPDGLMYVQYIHAWIFHHIPSYSINFHLVYTTSSFLKSMWFPQPWDSPPQRHLSLRCRQNGWVLWWATAMCPMFMETFDWREGIWASQNVFLLGCVIYVSWKLVLFDGHWELKVPWN